MELIVKVNDQTVEIRYPYYVLKKIERENGSLFSFVKPTLENTEKLIGYGLVHAKDDLGVQEIADKHVENVIEQLIEESSVMDAITTVLRHYMHTLNPKAAEATAGEELGEEGLAQVQNVVSNMFGL